MKTPVRLIPVNRPHSPYAAWLPPPEDVVRACANGAVGWPTQADLAPIAFPWWNPAPRAPAVLIPVFLPAAIHALAARAPHLTEEMFRGIWHDLRVQCVDLRLSKQIEYRDLLPCMPCLAWKYGSAFFFFVKYEEPE